MFTYISENDSDEEPDGRVNFALLHWLEFIAGVTYRADPGSTASFVPVDLASANFAGAFDAHPLVPPDLEFTGSASFSNDGWLLVPAGAAVACRVNFTWERTITVDIHHAFRIEVTTTLADNQDWETSRIFDWFINDGAAISGGEIGTVPGNLVLPFTIPASEVPFGLKIRVSANAVETCSGSLVGTVEIVL